jgi:hypothetical protein
MIKIKIEADSKRPITEGKFAGFARTVTSPLITRTPGPSGISQLNGERSHRAGFRVIVPSTKGCSLWQSKGPEIWLYCLILHLLCSLKTPWNNAEARFSK